MKQTISTLTLCILLCGSCLAQQPLVLNLDKATWRLDVGGLYNPVPGNLAFKFKPWHGYNGMWDGYLTQGQNPPKSFLTTQSLTIHVRVTTLAGAPYFHTNDNPDNECPPCCQPAAFRPYFTSGYIYGADLTRWWAHDNITGAITLVSPTDMILTVSFDPANWSSVNGGLGSDHLTEFNYSLTHMAFIGATMGGGCFFSHGTATESGTCRLELLEYSIQ